MSVCLVLIYTGFLSLGIIIPTATLNPAILATVDDREYK